MPSELDVLEAIHTARMLRVLKPDPVPDELIQRILEAAICAPSAGNAQQWIFLAVQDAAQRRRLGESYRKASAVVRAYYLAQGRPAHMTEAEFERFMKSGIHLHEHMGEAPVILLRACIWSSALCRIRYRLKRGRSCTRRRCGWPRRASTRPCRTSFSLAARSGSAPA